MATFWMLYFLVLGQGMLRLDLHEIREDLKGIFWPVFLRGGVALAGLQGIWALISSYFAS